MSPWRHRINRQSPGGCCREGRSPGFGAAGSAGRGVPAVSGNRGSRQGRRLSEEDLRGCRRPREGWPDARGARDPRDGGRTDAGERDAQPSSDPRCSGRRTNWRAPKPRIRRRASDVPAAGRRDRRRGRTWWRSRRSTTRGRRTGRPKRRSPPRSPRCGRRAAAGRGLAGGRREDEHHERLRAISPRRSRASSRNAMPTPAP